MTRKGSRRQGQSRKPLEKKKAYDTARQGPAWRDRDAVQTGKLGVDLSVQMQNLRNQTGST